MAAATAQPHQSLRPCSRSGMASLDFLPIAEHAMTLPAPPEKYPFVGTQYPSPYPSPYTSIPASQEDTFSSAFRRAHPGGSSVRPNHGRSGELAPRSDFFSTSNSAGGTEGGSGELAPSYTLPPANGRPRVHRACPGQAELHPAQGRSSELAPPCQSAFENESQWPGRGPNQEVARAYAGFPSGTAPHDSAGTAAGTTAGAQWQMLSEPAGPWRPMNSAQGDQGAAPPAAGFRGAAVFKLSSMMPLQQQAGSGAPKGVSCRYTSWTGTGPHLGDQEGELLDCIEDNYEEEDSLEAAAASLRRLTMMPAGKDSAGLSNPFSWKQLEQSCRQLDAANIRIEEIDLSCVEEEVSPSGVAYNFRLGATSDSPRDSMPVPEDNAQGMEPLATEDRTALLFKDSPASSVQAGTSTCSSSLRRSSLDSSLGSGPLASSGPPSKQGSADFKADLKASNPPAPSSLAPKPASGVASPAAGVAGSSGVGASVSACVTGEGAAPLGCTETFPEPRTVQRSMRISSLVRHVKERCGLLFTSSAKAGRRRPQL